jgi:hypothetical protein
MSRYYSYLLSSLPVLQFGMNPPFAMDSYLEMLPGFLPEDEMDAIRKFAREDVISLSDDIPAIREYQSFDTALRNHVVRLRCIDLDVAPEKHLRLREEISDQWIEQYALEAYKSVSPLESERILDQARWRCLDEIASGHIFDFPTLVIYAMKLRILVKWHEIAVADTNMIFNRTISSFNLKDLPISRL